MKLPFSVEDYYGARFTVEPVMKSNGPNVYLEIAIPAEGDGQLERQDFFRFELEDALNLAEAIKAAAEARF